MLHPVLVEVGGVPIGTHDVFVALGVVVGAHVFVREARYRGATDERRACPGPR